MKLKSRLGLGIPILGALSSIAISIGLLFRQPMNASDVNLQIALFIISVGLPIGAVSLSLAQNAAPEEETVLDQDNIS